MSFACQASLKSRTRLAVSAVGVGGVWAAAMRRRAEVASCRQAAGERPTISATSGNG